MADPHPHLDAPSLANLGHETLIHSPSSSHPTATTTGKTSDAHSEDLAHTHSGLDSSCNSRSFAHLDPEALAKSCCKDYRAPPYCVAP